MKLSRIKLGSIDKFFAKHSLLKSGTAQFRQSLHNPRVFIVTTEYGSGKFKTNKVPKNTRDFLRTIDSYMEENGLYLYEAILKRDHIGRCLACLPYYKLGGSLYK